MSESIEKAEVNKETQPTVDAGIVALKESIQKKN